MDLQQEIRGFKFGAQAALDSDEAALESVPFGWNSAFRSIGQGQATLGTRPGLRIVNTTALTSSPAFHLIRNYPYFSTTITNKLALVTAIGRLYFKDDTNTIGSEITPPSNFPYTSGHAFASGDFPVDATVNNNRLFMVNNNNERRSVLNETFKMFGMAPLTVVAISNQATGSSSMPAETYDVATTTYDSATGAESSATANTQVTLAASERIRVIITPSASESARNSHWRVYIRRQTTQSNLFRVLTFEDSGGSSIVTDGNIPIGTTTVYIDLTAAQIASLVLVAPSVTENNEPPSTAQFIESFGGRLFVADLTTFYWSKLALPDAFPPSNQHRLNTGDGDEIRGLCALNDDLLLVFTASNVWGVFGNDPQTWDIKPLERTVGCASFRSIVKVPGGVMWWSDTHGPVKFDGSNLELVGLDKLGPEICLDDTEGARHGHIVAGYDEQGMRALFSYTLDSGTRNTAILPFHIRMNQFEATQWNPMDMSNFGTGYDTDDKLRLFCGNYAGQLFILDSATQNDAVPSGTTEGTFVPASSSIATITSTGFYTTGAALAERYVVVKNATGHIVGRERITSNTSTVLTLAANITSLTAGEEHTFVVGGQDFRLYTKTLDFQQAFNRKRVDNVYVHIRTGTDTESLLLGTLINYNPSIGTLYQGWSNTGTAWDAEDAIWDSALWGGGGEAKKRFRVVRNCTAIQVGLFHCSANTEFVILKITALARALSDRYYG